MCIVHEIILDDVFKRSFGPSSGPDIALFKRFRENWPHTDSDDFKTALQDMTCSEILAAHSQLRFNAIVSAKEHFTI